MVQHLRNDTSSDSANSTPSTTSSISERLYGQDGSNAVRTHRTNPTIQHRRQNQNQNQLDELQMLFESHNDRIRHLQQQQQLRQQQLHQHQQRLAEQQPYQLLQLNRIHQEHLQRQHQLEQQQQQQPQPQSQPQPQPQYEHQQQHQHNLLRQDQNQQHQQPHQHHHQLVSPPIQTSPTGTGRSELSQAPDESQGQPQVEANNSNLDGSDLSSQSPPSKRVRKARSKYFSPCDACSFRKVKCDQKRPCSKCLAHSIPCTNNRMRKRCGPKHLRRKTREVIDMMTRDDSSDHFSNQNLLLQLLFGAESTASAHLPLTIDMLLPFLQVFQTWYYGVWPVVSVAHLVAELTKTTQIDSTKIVLTQSNIPAYALSCAIAAAIDSKVTFLTTKAELLNLPTEITGSQFAEECVRSRSMTEFRERPSAEALLTSFFLYAHYVNIKLGLLTSMVYLREAITMAQIMGLHNPETYDDLPTAEGHRLRKIYYMLLVTERFMCISDNLPVILDVAIPYPELEDEEYSALLRGFSELVKVFAIPDKRFFVKMITSKSLANSSMSSIISAASSDGGPSGPNWIQRVQDQLTNILVTSQTPEIPKLNILLSKYWMMCLAWHVTRRCGLLVGDENDNNCFSIMYPIKIARDFIEETSSLTIFAFESNGPGVCIKLLEIALGLMDSLTTTMSSEGFASLYKVFMLVHKLKNDITLPVKLYQRVEKVIQNQVLPTRGYISELTEEEIQTTTEKKQQQEQIMDSHQPPPPATNYSLFSFENQVLEQQQQQQSNVQYFQPEVDQNSIQQFHGSKLILSPFTLFQQFSEQQLLQTPGASAIPEQQRYTSAVSNDPNMDMGNPLFQVASAYSYPPSCDEKGNPLPREYRG